MKNLPKIIGEKRTIEDCTCNKFTTCDDCIRWMESRRNRNIFILVFAIIVYKVFGFGWHRKHLYPTSASFSESPSLIFARPVSASRRIRR